MTAKESGLILCFYLIYLAALGAFLFLGKQVLKFFGAHKLTRDYFIYGLTGITTLTIIFSLFYSRLTGSISLLLLLILIFWTYIIKKNNLIPSRQEPSKEETFKFFPVFITASIVFLINLFLRLSIFNWPFFKATKDEIFYALLTKFVENKHIECSAIDWHWFSGQISLRPYHYLEQWTNLLFVKGFQLSAMHALYFIVLPIFLFITVLGITMLAGYYTKLNSNFKLGLALLICFVGLPSLNLEDFSFWMNSPIPANFKYLTLFWLTFIAVVIIKEKQWNALFAFVAIFPLFNYGLYPVVLLFLIIYIFLFRYLFAEKQRLYVYLSYVFCIIGVPVLVKFNAAPDFHGIYDPKLKDLLLYYNNETIRKIKLIGGMGLLYLKNILLTNGVLILLIISAHLYLRKKKAVSYEMRNVRIVCMLILAGTFCISCILNFLLDAYQIFYLTFQMFAGIILIIVFFRVVNISSPSVQKVFAFVMFILFIVNVFMKSTDSNFEIFKRYDEQYRSQLKEEFNARYNGKDWVGVRFMNKDYYNSIYQIQSGDQYEGFSFAFLTDNVHMFTLNPDVVNDPNRPDPFGIYKFSYDRYSKAEYFYWWGRSVNLDVTKPSELELAQVKFIRDFHVNFIVAQKGAAVPDKLIAMTDRTIMCGVNGETMYFFKR